MYRRILYTSRAAENITMRDAYDIIRVSHNRNSAAGITGGLIFLDGYFYQLMEGLPSAIETRFARIAADSRHCDVVIRQDQAVDESVFKADWMALRDGSKIDPSILIDHQYQWGMPADQFDGAEVFAMLVDCFADELAAKA